MDRYAVIGHPVEHSLSPRIHAAFADQTGEAMAYGRIDPGAEGFASAARAFFAEGGSGLNVTVPFKAQAHALCASASERARSAGVVNTLVSTGAGVPHGDNTDGVGLVTDLVGNLGVGLRGRHVLLLGAGGAASGVIGPLLAEEPAAVVIANRTAERAHALAQRFAYLGEVRASGLTVAETGTDYAIVINASAASLGGGVPAVDPRVVRAGGVVYDMMYGAAARPFLAWAREAGAAVAADGLGMLVEQAAESFVVWRGIRPDTRPVRAQLASEAGETK